MSRINTNVQSLVAQRVLGANNASLNNTLERLSTGLRINRGKDDPAGLIASENLRAEKSSLNAAISNAERADQVSNIAEGGLQEVSGLLTELQGLTTASANSAGLSDQEKKANQLQIDSILQTIDRVAGATSFQGKRLLNGNLDYTTSSVNAGVSDYRVNAAKLQKGSKIGVQAIVTASAQQAGLYLSAAGTSINLGGSGSSFTVEISGSLGSRELQFASGTTLAKITSAVNTFSDVTGVKAQTSGNGIKLTSDKFGGTEFVSVRVVKAANIQGTGAGVYKLQAQNFNTVSSNTGVAFASATNGVRDSGQNLGATINGIQATADGKTARINTDFLDVELTLTDTQSQTQGAIDAFTITGGGADFQLAGQVDIAGKVSLGIGNIATRKLGTNTLGFLSDLASGKANNVTTGDLNKAQQIVSEAINQVSSTRGRLGAFQKNVVGATIRSLNVSLENTTAAESSIRDANFATETASLTRNQILVSASTNVLALANAAPQSVLQLLG